MRAPSRRVSDLTCDRRIALAGLRAAEAVVVRERRARTREAAGKCIADMLDGSRLRLCASVKLCTRSSNELQVRMTFGFMRCNACGRVGFAIKPEIMLH